MQQVLANSLSHSLLLSHSLTHSLSHLSLTLTLTLTPTLVRVVAVACAHVRAARSQCPCVRTFSVGDVGDSHTQRSVRGTKHPLLSGCVIVSRPLNANPWMSRQGDPEALLSSPASTQTDPARSSRNPADRAVGEHSWSVRRPNLKQDQNLAEWVSVPRRFPADSRDWKRPGVSMHERGPCISWGSGHMRQGSVPPSSRVTVAVRVSQGAG